MNIPKNEIIFLLSPQGSMALREFDEIETHPLWEYHCVALSMETTALTLDFSYPLPDQPIENSGTLSLVRSEAT